MNIILRGYFKQTGHVLAKATKRLNWLVWTVRTGAVPVAGTGLRSEALCQEAKRAEGPLGVKQGRELAG